MLKKNENLLGVHLARFLAGKSGLAGAEKDRLKVLVNHLSDALYNGHICLPVDNHDVGLLAKTPLVSEGDVTPLVLYRNSLYLHRYFSYESRLATQITHLAARAYSVSDLESYLDSIFGDAGKEEDLQRSAAKLAVEKALAIISGGPGTGKTSTVVRIIGIFLQVLGKDIKIALAAPTGKAAMRLHQSILGSIEGLPLPTEIKKSFPSKAHTLHRLLGTITNSPRFRHNHENPMEWDIVVVDEASMVDLALMSKLVDALKPDARLILLGDKDQLASVESGAVLYDLIETLSSNTIVLQKSYRFDHSIKELADAVNGNNIERVTALLDGEKYDNINHHEIGLQDDMLWDRYSNYMECVRNVDQSEYGNVFKEFNAFKILCAIRSGRRGVDIINLLVENYFKEKYGYVNEWYPGRPVMITRNDYTLELYNGDIGICLRDQQDGNLKIWFENNEGQLKTFLPYRLPEYQTAFALTIHKSQGSEFDDVIIVLPEEESPILSRELIYTAVTRARKNLWLCSSKEILQLTITAKIHRFSGLSSMVRALQ